jgi:hypothetical protein
MTTVHIPTPEFLTSRRDIQDDETPWVVNRALPLEGGSTDVGNKQMSVPYGDDPLSRYIRAHEMVHARVSPASGDARRLFNGLEPLWVDAGEEYRVNTIVKRAGFDAAALATGNEHIAGTQAASTNDWPGMIYMVGRLGGTGAFDRFVEGVEFINADYATVLRQIESKVAEYVSGIDNAALADTTESKTFKGAPRGFTRYARTIAEMLQQAASLMNSAVDADGNPVDIGDEFDPDAAIEQLRSGETGWARLILDTTVVLDRRLSGRLGRRRIATDMGRNPRRINRMLTDPHRKVFDRYSKGQGGVVLIDQSGSMRLSEEDLMGLVEAAPGCVVIGYSHPASSTDRPNVWVLAERGKVTSSIPSAGRGNGVDGPAIRFAQKKRRSGEPFVWVCDGVVTNADDDHVAALDEECAALVRKHGIHMVYDTDAALAALKRAASGERLRARPVGNVADTDTWRHGS